MLTKRTLIPLDPSLNTRVVVARDTEKTKAPAHEAVEKQNIDDNRGAGGAAQIEQAAVDTT